jgi:hypothetical protein
MIDAKQENRQFVDEKFGKSFESTGKMLKKYGNLKRNKSVFLLTSCFFKSRVKTHTRKIHANFIPWKFGKFTLYLLVSSSK